MLTAVKWLARERVRGIPTDVQQFDLLPWSKLEFLVAKIVCNGCVCVCVCVVCRGEGDACRVVYAYALWR